MSTQVFSDPLAKISPVVAEIYDRAEQNDDEIIKGLCLRLYVELAKARKGLGLTNLPAPLLHQDGSA